MLGSLSKDDPWLHESSLDGISPSECSRALHKVYKLTALSMISMVLPHTTVGFLLPFVLALAK